MPSTTSERKSMKLPGLRENCRKCRKQTGTTILFMPAGIGNACADCGALRKLPDAKPYLRSTDYEQLKRDYCAEGKNNGTPRLD